LNKQLDSTNKQIFDEHEDDKDKLAVQQQKLKFRAQLEKQTKEIDILKTEINLYKKKGGHIYTKVTTNRRVAHHLND
jgi:predicted ribosome quality control (RQC) complex YloA/Tae2 family protein